MRGLNASRRQVLGAATALLGLAAAPRAWAAPYDRASFIIDARLPEGPPLIERARASSHPIADPQGEIIRLLLGPQGPVLTRAGTIIGLSTYTDFVLARDMFRNVGRSVRGVLALPLTRDEAAEPLLTLLHDACQRRCASQASAFLWLA